MVLPSKVKTVLIFLGVALPPLAGGIYFFTQTGLNLPPVVFVIGGLIGVPFFTLCAIYALRRLVFVRPTLVVDHAGIVDNGSLVAVGRITWDEIKDVRPYTFSGRKLLGIELHDAEVVISRQPLWKRLWLRANHRLSDFPISIAQSMLPMPVEELALQIRDRFRP